MRLVVHCFAENATITPNKFDFKFKEFDGCIYSSEKQLTLQLSKTMTPKELESFEIKDRNGVEARQVTRESLDKKLKPYKLILTEAAHLFEGLFSLMYHSVPPHFDTGKINVNLYADTMDEKKLLDDDLIYRGAGYVISDGANKYQIDRSITDLIEPSLLHLPVFSFFSTALRALKSNDNEVAFFLFFRIIDGYFANGAKDIENELKKNASQLQRFIPYDVTLTESLKTILNDLGLKSKSEQNFNGLISDIVLIRHKLVHFSSEKSKSHHTAVAKIELVTVNNYLYNCCFNLIREKLGSDLKE